MFVLYAKFIVRRPCLILLVVSGISITLSVIPLVSHALPSFTDPMSGFETRGTKLAQRFIAWANLVDEIRPSQRLAVNPQEIDDQNRMRNHTLHRKRQMKLRAGYTRISNNGYPHLDYNMTGIEKLWPDETEADISTERWVYGTNVTFEDDNALKKREEAKKQWAAIKKMRKKQPKPIDEGSGACGAPAAVNAHLVVTSIDNTSMLTFENIQRMCKLQEKIVDATETHYYAACHRSLYAEDVCCPVWSLPNYIALITGKMSCDSITREDLNITINILRACSSYFHNYTLLSYCDASGCPVPKYCSQYDAIYNLFFYILDSNAFSPPNYNEFVKNAMIFFPLASSSIILPLYQQLQPSELSYENLIVPAIDFGLKNALFDAWVVQDIWLIALGGLFVFQCVWFYTKSLSLTLLLFTAISYSLGVAYFLYVYVFNLKFFPFMNLLVIVIVIGIGADDAFVYVKIWNMVSNQLIKNNIDSLQITVNEVGNSPVSDTIIEQVLVETLNHSVSTIFVTTVTTAVAFFASYVSFIPAINCFSIFAGTAVLVNFVIIITCLPAAVFLVDVKMFKIKNKGIIKIYKKINDTWHDIRIKMNKYVVECVAKLHITLVVLLGAIGIGSIVTFYHPGLQLPESRQFQLFRSSHPFEQYDIVYKNKFLFESFGNNLSAESRMPLRWVWGVKNIDNGNHMNPAATGKLEFDHSFSMSDPESQLWLFNFCRKIKSQPFYHPTSGPLLSNCFIETFREFMSRRCLDKIDRINRAPCCEEYQFPFRKELFDYCIIKAIVKLYETPRDLFTPGHAGPKFLRRNPTKISALVVEFDSVVPYSLSYKDMNSFYNEVENFTRTQLESAPPGMKNGWFISDLQFYDLQNTLASGTIIALILSAALGFGILWPSTHSLLVSLCALSSMIFSSTVTISILVLCGWKLNILESVAISTSAGLSVDFNLHYALSYTVTKSTRDQNVKYALNASAGPTAAAALTSGFAGIFLLSSHLLPYVQIGTFLALIMTVSWIYATFFLCSLLYLFGPDNVELVDDRRSSSIGGSICCSMQNAESHELEQIAHSNPTNVTQSPSSPSAAPYHDEPVSEIGETSAKDTTNERL